jgi:hypothetical protein
MKSIAALTIAALGITLTACGAGHQPPSPLATVTVTISAGGTKAASPVATSPSATANERALIDGLAASIPVIPARVVAGPLMRAYVRIQTAYAAALGAIGSPDTAGKVSDRAGGGFKTCYPAVNGNRAYCVAFTQFTTNRAGQVTGMAVDGQPVAGRIATAPNATSGGLTISGVVAYRLTRQNVVVVAFKLTDSSYRPINTSPSLLASLNGASDAVSQDALPAFLAPGDSLSAAAGFDITQTTGQFCLQPNGGSASLPCTTLTKV